MIENSVPRILVVEDEAIVAMQIAKTLRRLGYSVCSASSGEDAIKLAKEERPDLALMDIMLEGEMDGVQAAAHLTTHYGIPVVYLTANGDESTVHRAKLTQPYGYILKPFQEARLRSTVDLALHRRAVANRIQGGLGSSPPVLERLEDAVFAADASLRLVYLNLAGESLINAHLDNVRGMDLAVIPELARGPARDPARGRGARHEDGSRDGSFQSRHEASGQRLGHPCRRYHRAGGPEQGRRHGSGGDVPQHRTHEWE